MQYVSLRRKSDGSPDCPQLGDMVFNSSEYKSVASAVISIIDSAAVFAESYISQFKEFIPVFEFGLTWNVEKYALEEPNIDFFTSELNKFQEWSQSLEKIPVSSSRGILFIDSKALKLTLSPIPQKALNDLIRYLIQLGSDKTLALLNLFKSATKQLASEPTTMKEFVEFVQYLRPLQARAQNCTKDIQLCEEIYMLLEDFQASVPANDLERKSLIHNVFGRFKESLSLAQQCRTKLMPAHSKSLEKLVHQNNASLDLLFKKLGEGIFITPSSATTEILTQLKEVSLQVDELKEKAERFAQWQEILEMGGGTGSILLATKDRLTSTKLLWENVQRWQAQKEIFETE